MDTFSIFCGVFGLIFFLAAIATYCPKLDVSMQPDDDFEKRCTFHELPTPSKFDYFGQVDDVHHSYTSSVEPGLFVLHEDEIPKSINGEIQEHFRTT